MTSYSIFFYLENESDEEIGEAGKTVEESACQVNINVIEEGNDPSGYHAYSQTDQKRLFSPCKWYYCIILASATIKISWHLIFENGLSNMTGPWWMMIDILGACPSHEIPYQLSNCLRTRCKEYFATYPRSKVYVSLRMEVATGQRYYIVLQC